MRLGLTEKFLAEGQPETGKNGHVLAAVSHRCSYTPLLKHETGCAHNPWEIVILGPDLLPPEPALVR